ILDGEIVAWSQYGSGTLARQTSTSATNRDENEARALPFSTLQQRLGRKKVSEKMMREIPVAYFVFDILCSEGELLLDLPLRERAQILDKLLASPRTRAVLQAQAQSQFAFGGDEPSCAA